MNDPRAKHGNTPQSPHSPADLRVRRRNRIALIGLFAMFLVPILIAAWLNHTGKRPAPTRQHGELLEPRPDLRDLGPTLADGSTYAWTPGERIWRIAIAPPADCGDPCAALAAEISTVWQLFGKDADQAHVLWLCPPGPCKPPASIPTDALRTIQHDPALRARLPQVDDPRGVPVYVIDPYGYVVLRYPPGFDSAGLRSDVARLLKLM